MSQFEREIKQLEKAMLFLAWVLGILVVTIAVMLVREYTCDCTLGGHHEQVALDPADCVKHGKDAE